MHSSNATLTAAKLSAWSTGLVRVMGNFGDESTPRKLCSAIGDIVPIDIASIFVLNRHSAPIEIFNEVPFDTYIDSPYLLDPVYNHFLKGTLPICSSMEDLCPDDFFKSDFFVHYWKRISIISEFSFNATYDADTTIHLPLNRTSSTQEFSQDEIELMTAISPVVVTVMSHFWDAQKSNFVNRGEKADEFHRHLTFVLDNFGTSILTSRELDVMQLTMRGYSDKLTARELTITPGTVRNHKKSIFSKLRVSSQGQVFGLLLDVLRQPANDNVGTDPLAALLEERGQAGGH